MNEHLLIEQNEQHQFYKVTCTEGHIITMWDGENILDYSYGKTLYCPLTTDLGKIRCLTDEQHQEYLEQQRIAMEERRKEIEESRNTPIATATTMSATTIMSGTTFSE